MGSHEDEGRMTRGSTGQTHSWPPQSRPERAPRPLGPPNRHVSARLPRQQLPQHHAKRVDVSSLRGWARGEALQGSGFSGSDRPQGGGGEEPREHGSPWQRGCETSAAAKTRHPPAGAAARLAVAPLLGHLWRAPPRVVLRGRGRKPLPPSQKKPARAAQPRQRGSAHTQGPAPCPQTKAPPGRGRGAPCCSARPRPPLARSTAGCSPARIGRRRCRGICSATG